MVRTMKKNLKRIIAVLLAFAFIAAPAAKVTFAAEDTKFSDVAVDNQYYEEIMELAEEGVINGRADKTFGPNDPVYRQHAAKMIVGALGLDVKGEHPSFKDVPVGNEFAEFIAVAEDEEIFTGNLDKDFGFGEKLTRRQAASVIVRAFDLEAGDKEVSFKDIDSSADVDANEAIEILASNGIVNGYLDSTYRPNVEVTRGHIAKMIVNAREVAAEQDELVVKSVSAITQTIAANKDVDLKFEVNGKEVTKAEFDETYGEEDYTVKFLYNFTSTDANKAGKVNKDTGTFKYAVQVYLEGKKVNEVKAADFVDVKVVKSEKAVSIEKVVLSNELDYLMVGEEEVEFEVTEAKNALGKDLDKDSLKVLSEQDLEKVVSSDVTVAYVGSDNNIEVRKTGKVTFTLTYYKGDDAITVKLPVKVKEAGVATTVETENQKVAAGTEATAKNLGFKVFDQHGLDITNSTDAYDVRIKNVDGNTVKNLNTKGIYTVEILDKAKEAKVLGSFTVTVVDVDNVDYDEFFFEDIKDAEGKEIVLDINVDTEKQNLTKTLNLKGKKDGVTVVAKDVTKDEGYDFDFDKEVFSDVTIADGLVTVQVDKTKLKEATTSTIKLTHTQGDLVQELAEIELEIKNTTVQINNLTLAEGVKKLAVKESDKATGWDVNDITQLRSTDVKDADGKVTELKEDMIAKVEFSANDGKAIVTIADIYGGKEFVFDAIDKAEAAIEVTKALFGTGNNPEKFRNYAVAYKNLADVAFDIDNEAKDIKVEITYKDNEDKEQVLELDRSSGAEYNKETGKQVFHVKYDEDVAGELKKGATVTITVTDMAGVTQTITDDVQIAIK